jgi:hypothetical protein
MDRVLDTLTQSILGRASKDPRALTFLLRRYAATGRDDVRDVIEPALTAALEASLPEADGSLADHVLMLAEASAVTDDDRVARATIAGAGALRRRWPSRGTVGDAMRTIDACLSATFVRGCDSGEAIASAVDELERVVCLVYQPGEHLARLLTRPDEPDGTLGDHVFAAQALLTAHAVTGRLPYSMLAEELTEAARDLAEAATFVERCECVRVLCRLALLHDDAEYRAAAVVARDRDYRGVAGRLADALGLAHLIGQAHRSGAPYSEDEDEAAAVYGLALDELSRAS